MTKDFVFVYIDKDNNKANQTCSKVTQINIYDTYSLSQGLYYLSLYLNFLINIDCKYIFGMPLYTKKPQKMEYMF